MYGTIILFKPKDEPCKHRISWKIAIGINDERVNMPDIFLQINSNWSYLSEVAAINAANKWANRFGITLIEQTQGHKRIS